MMDRHIVARKLTRARNWLADAANRLDQPRDPFLADADARDLATFHLFLAMQEVIDLAVHWVVDAGWEAPDDAGGAFDVLASKGVLTVAAATQLRAMVGLRNRIAHGYATIDHERLHEEAASGVAVMREFLVAIADAAGL